MSASTQQSDVVMNMEPIEDERLSDKQNVKACCGRKMKKNNILLALTFASVFVGIVLGIGLRHASLSENAKALVAFPGEILLRLLKMMAIPLIMTSIVSGVADLYRRKSGRVGLHIIIYYISTTFCAICIGLALALVIQPGRQKQAQRMESSSRDAKSTFSTLDTVLDLIRNLFPKNLIEAWFRADSTKTTFVKQTTNNSLNFSSNFTTKVIKTLETTNGSNALGLITFCLMLGIALGKRKKSEGEVLNRFFNELFNVFMDVVMNIMWYAPVGICSLIAGNLLQVGDMLFTMRTLGLYMTTIIVSLFIQTMLVYSAIYWIVTRKNPLKMYLGSLQAILTAAGTSSSAATLPVTMHCAEENLKIDKRFTRLVLPLGATVNMDGGAMFQGIVTVTVAQINGVTLSFGQILTVCITGSLASVGAAAIPGSGIVVVLFVLQSVGLPVETIGLLYTVDWFLERLRVIVNILGDITGVCVISYLHRESFDVSKEEFEMLDAEGERESSVC